MPTSERNKTRHPLLLLRASRNGEAHSSRTTEEDVPSPFMVLTGICHLNDIAVRNMHQGHLESAICMLSSAVRNFGKIVDPSSYAKVEARTCTFHATLPGQGTLPSFLEVNHERGDYEDFLTKASHLFTNAMRLSNSNFPANFTSAWAVVHFNLGLARHVQAVEAKEGSKAATNLFGVATKHYKSSLSPSFDKQQKSLPKLIQAAILCNLVQSSVGNANDAKQYQDKFTEAFEALDTPEDRVIVTNCVSFTAMVA